MTTYARDGAIVRTLANVQMALTVLFVFLRFIQHTLNVAGIWGFYRLSTVRGFKKLKKI